MASVFVRVPVSERLPSVETKVQTIHEHMVYGEQIEVMVLDKKGNWFFYPSDVHGCEPEFWLEEVELPTDDEILEATLIKQEKDQTQFMRGIDFLMNWIKKGGK